MFGFLITIEKNKDLKIAFIEFYFNKSYFEFNIEIINGVHINQKRDNHFEKYD